MEMSCCRRTRRVSAYWALTTSLILAAFSHQSASAITVPEVVQQVSLESYTDYLQNELYTHDGDERCFGPQHDLAQARIRERFESFGLETSLDPFEYGQTTCYNVVGMHPGISCPNEIYVLGAHYDTVADCPGAWDNASGVAAVLEAARVLSQQAFEATLVFIAFDREEQGLLGSAAYVHDHQQDRIHGMVNIDSVAWRAYGPGHPDYNTISLCYASKPTGLTDDLASALASYSGLKCVVDSLEVSDHKSFDDEGFAAALLCSYDMWNNPFHHAPRDSVDQPDYIDYDHGARVTRGVVGYLATAAKLAPARILPDFDADGDVDIDDCCLLIEHWKGSDLQFDIAPPPSGDGMVDAQDLDALLHYWLGGWSSWWQDFGLIAHWTLDEKEGHIAHDSLGDNNAELLGDPPWQPTGGMIDGALRFDGVDDFVGTEYVLDPAEDSFTVFAWIKGGAPGQTVVSQLWAVNWLSADPVGGYLRTDLREASHAAQSLVSEVAVTDGDWHRVGLTWDGTNRVLYVDNTQVVADTQPGLAQSIEGLNIGCGPDMAPGTFFAGLIDDVRIYNRAVKP
jgi:hypothetical protein